MNSDTLECDQRADTWTCRLEKDSGVETWEDINPLNLRGFDHVKGDEAGIRVDASDINCKEENQNNFQRQLGFTGLTCEQDSR